MVMRAIGPEAGARAINTRTKLLTVDGAANLLFEVALLAFPRPVFEAVGLPLAGRGVSPTILGGVLIGIGIALMQESRSKGGNTSGLDLGGAVAINLTAGLAIAGWLLLSETSDLSFLGQILLWVLVLFLVSPSGGEVIARMRAGKGLDSLD